MSEKIYLNVFKKRDVLRNLKCMIASAEEKSGKNFMIDFGGDTKETYYSYLLEYFPLCIVALIYDYIYLGNFDILWNTVPMYGIDGRHANFRNYRHIFSYKSVKNSLVSLQELFSPYSNNQCEIRICHDESLCIKNGNVYVKTQDFVIDPFEFVKFMYINFMHAEYTFMHSEFAYENEMNTTAGYARLIRPHLIMAKNDEKAIVLILKTLKQKIDGADYKILNDIINEEKGKLYLFIREKNRIINIAKFDEDTLIDLSNKIRRMYYINRLITQCYEHVKKSLILMLNTSISNDIIYAPIFSMYIPERFLKLVDKKMEEELFIIEKKTNEIYSFVVSGGNKYKLLDYLISCKLKDDVYLDVREIVDTDYEYVFLSMKITDIDHLVYAHKCNRNDLMKIRERVKKLLWLQQI